jgi:hypothetical protein
MYKLAEKIPEESCLENEGAREWVPLLLSNDQETSCPGRHEHDGINEVVRRLTGKLYHRDTMQSSVSQFLSLTDAFPTYTDL